MHAIYSAWNNLEAAYMFYSKGLLDQNDYESWIAGTCQQYSLPGIRTILDNGIIVMNSQFIEFVRRECDS